MNPAHEVFDFGAASGGRRIFYCLYPFLLVCLLSACSSTDGIMRLSDGSPVRLPEMVEDLKGADVVFVGELHTVRGHHRMQLDVIRALDEEGLNFAIGFEMFRAASQKALDNWVSGEMDEEDFKKIYMDNWGVEWSQYSDIFYYARRNSIPMIGLNIDERIPRQVARKGFDSLTEKEIKELPGVSCDVDPRYRDFIRRALGKHGNDGMIFKNFCEAQMVRDSTMAWRVLEFLKDNPGYRMVVLAGNAHSWKPGIPAQVRKRKDLSMRVVLPGVRGRVDGSNVTAEDADYLWLDR